MMHEHGCSDFYISCINCLGEVRVRPPARSGASLVEWSDGFGSWQSTDYCRYSSCPVCGLAFWLDDAQRTSRVAEATPRDLAQGTAILLAAGWLTGSPVPFDNAKLPDHGEDFVRPAGNTQVALALSKCGLPLERQRYLRIHLWWRSNHFARNSTESSAEAIPDSSRKACLEWLLSDFESRPNEDRDVVIEAELLRELGHFDKAIERVREASEGGSLRARVIYEHAQQEISTVCITREDDRVVVW